MKTNVTISLATLNCQSLRTDKRLQTLEEALENVNLDVCALTEVKRDGNGTTVLNKSKSNLYYTGNGKHNGVGFLVKSHFNKQVRRFEPINDRICYLDVEMERVLLRIVCVYLPTTSYTDAEYNNYLAQIEQIINKKEPGKPLQIVVAGDFNAQPGKRLTVNEASMGMYGYGDRNERGETLIDWCERNGLKVANSFSKRREGRKWTWRSPNGTTYREYDLFLVTKACHSRSVDVVNQFNYGSDHRLVRCILDVEWKGRRWGKKSCIRTVDWNIYKAELELKNVPLNVMNNAQLYEETANTMRECLSEATNWMPKESRFGNATKQLFTTRRQFLTRQDPQGKVQLVQTNKLLRIQIAEDLDKYHLSLYKTNILTNKRRQKEQTTRTNLTATRKQDGTLTKDSTELMHERQKFYNNLFKSNNANVTQQGPIDQVPEITIEEFQWNLCNLKRNVAPGQDRVCTEMILKANHEVKERIRSILNECLRSGIVPNNMCHSVISLIFKSGDPHQLANFRPIAVSSTLLKLLVRTIHRRIELLLESNQTSVQAGFRKNFSTNDHILTLKQLIDKCYSHNLQIFLIFVDFAKAYDSIEHEAVWTSLERQGVNRQYINILKYIYHAGQTKIKVGEDEVQIEVKKGVRQGCPLSPVIFNAVLETVMRRLEWEDKGININGRNLTHLCYADDVALIAKSPQMAQQMIDDLVQEAKTVGLRINQKKTVAMSNLRESPLKLDGTNLKFVDQFVYLGRSLSFKHDDSKEITRRIQSGWCAFNRHRKFLVQRSIDIKRRRKVFNIAVLPAFLYACETWALTKKDKKKLRSVQRRMERAMTHRQLQDRIPHAQIRRETQVKDVLKEASKRKMKWAKKLACCGDGRWTKDLIEWYPREKKRRGGRQYTEWADDLKEAAERLGRQGVTWATIARTEKALWQQMSSLRYDL